MATATTGTVTVNAAFLQEIKDVNLDLWRLLQEIREFCCDPYRIGARRNQFIGMLEDLRDHLALHFALEEAYGYFDDPVDVAPWLCEAAIELRSEHQHLYLASCDLIDRAEHLMDRYRVSTLVRDMVREFHEFDARLQRHESREIDLIQQEYDEDIGVGD